MTSYNSSFAETNKEINKKKSTTANLLSNHGRFIFLILFLFILIIASSAQFMYQSYQRLTHQSSQEQAQLLTTTLREIRTFYTNDVVLTAKNSGLKISHDYDKNLGELPLPATMSMILGNRIGKITGGAYSKLYSPYPFPWRAEGGLNDDFQKKAWQSLSDNPKKAVFQFEILNNEEVFRYATADIMRSACIDCHNSHPDTPKVGWKVGDLRGILEVVVPVKNITAIADNDFYKGLGYISIILFCSLGVVTGIVKKLHNNLTKIQKTNEQLDLLATYDALTGLYNRRMLVEHLRYAVYLAERNKQKFSILYFNLDGFKRINDIYGHTFGDELLKQIAERIKNITRESDIFARMGGDEFILLIDSTVELDNIIEIANKVIKSIEVPFYYKEQTLQVTTSIGITTFPSGGSTPEELIQNADAAMYHAKESGRNCYKYYSSTMNDMIKHQLEMETDIKNALKNNEFFLHYQPKVSRNGKVDSAEALIRWLHPQKGTIRPDQFIPIAEKSYLIIEIGKWVREEVCKQLLIWKQNDFPPIKVSVNVAAVEFSKKIVLQHLLDLFMKYDIDQHLLELEITEGTLMSSVDEGNMDYRILKNMNIGLSIDDFGTGYSSLGYLKSYPIDTLKIDKSFVDNIMTHSRDASITKTIIAMAHSLDMKVVAEGVEDKEQLKFLLDNGCDQIQGYYFSKPILVDDFEQYVLAKNL